MPLSDDELHFFHSIRLLTPEEAFEQLVMRYALDTDRNNIAYLQAIHEQLIAFSSNKIGDIPLFLEWWEEKGRTQSLSEEQREL